MFHWFFHFVVVFEASFLLYVVIYLISTFFIQHKCVQIMKSPTFLANKYYWKWHLLLFLCKLLSCLLRTRIGSEVLSEWHELFLFCEWQNDTNDRKIYSFTFICKIYFHFRLGFVLIKVSFKLWMVKVWYLIWNLRRFQEILCD